MIQAMKALEAAEASRQPAAMTQALTQVGLCYRRHGEHGAARRYLEHALRWARTLGAVDASIELLVELADLAAMQATSTKPPASEATARSARELARDCGFEAARLAERSADGSWELAVLMRVSDILDRCGDHDDAIAMQRRALGLMAREQFAYPAAA